MPKKESKSVKKIELTKIQQAYLVGSFDSKFLGGVNCQGYIEVGLGNVDEEIIKSYWNKIISNHNMLRSEFKEGKILIPIIKDFNNQPLKTIDLTNLGLKTKEKKLESLRAYMENIDYKKQNVPYVATLIKEDGMLILALSINLMFIDFRSVQIILEEIHSLINGDEIIDDNDDITLLLNKNKECNYFVKESDINYWKSQDLGKINMLDSNAWTINKDISKLVKFSRVSHTMPRTESKKLIEISKKMNLSISAVFLSAYSLTLHVWGEREKNVINIPVSNRNKFSSKYINLVSEFTEVLLLYTETLDNSTFKDFSSDVFDKLIEDLDHSSYSCLDLINEINREGKETIIYPFVFTGVLKSARKNKIRYGSSKTPQVLIDCQIIENESEEFLISWDYRNCFSEEIIIKKYFKLFCKFLLELSENEELWHMTTKEIKERIYFNKNRKILNSIDIYEAAETLDKQIEKQILTEEIKKVNINEFNSILKETILSEIFKNLKTNGLFRNGKETYGSIYKKTRVKDRNKRGLISILNLLCKNGFLEKKEQAFIDNNKISKYTIDLLKKRSDFKKISSNVTLDYIKSNTNSFVSILSGDTDPLSILFPMGRQNIAKAFYSETIVYVYLNKLVAGLIKYIVENRKYSNILEVGGGTGVTTEYIFKEISGLSSSKYKYKFTDKSRFFINQIGMDNIDTAIMDLDLNLEKSEKFDVIIAVGVLNNVININFTLNNLNQILSDDGIIIIVEPVNEHIEINVTQAFLMPIHMDSRRNSNNCFFTIEEWKEVFKKNNFYLLSSKPSAESWFSLFEQKIFIIKKG